MVDGDINLPEKRHPRRFLPRKKDVLVVSCPGKTMSSSFPVSSLQTSRKLVSKRMMNEDKLRVIK